MMKLSSWLLPQRNATLGDAPGIVPQQPSVALVVPILNEATHLEPLLGDLRAQDYIDIVEIWLVDGGSTDGSVHILHRACEADPRFRLVGNPKRLPAAAVNIVVGRTKADVVMRLDAHASYATDVVSQSIRTLLATGAAGVGAIQRPAPGRSPVAQAIVSVHHSCVGIGVASFRREAACGWVDSIWNGCYWRHVLAETGPLREDLPRVEDNDLNQRIRALGYGLYLDPKIRATYFPRTTISALAKQYFTNGLGCGRALLQAPRALAFRHLAPAVLVAGLFSSSMIAVFWPAILPAALGLPIAYVLALTLVGCMAMAREPIAQAMLLVPVLAALHLSYGAGTLYGLIPRRSSP